MTQVFEVLNKELNIHRNYLIEASAGTGKTFSIENIVVRLLLEAHPQKNEPLALEEILIVTFTKAAAYDLKQRIRSNIEKALAKLSLPKASTATFPYLDVYLEEGGNILAKAIKRLEHALFCFDKAQIYTIHSFCARMLSENIFEGDIDLSSPSPDEALAATEAKRIIRNFFRTEVTSEKYCPKQVDIALRHCRNDPAALENKI